MVNNDFKKWFLTDLIGVRLYIIIEGILYLKGVKNKMFLLINLITW